MSNQNDDPEGRAARLLREITALLPEGAHRRAIHDAAAGVTRAGAARPAIAVLAESTGDQRLAGHDRWAALLGAGAAGITPARSALGYVTVVRLHPADSERTTVRGARVTLLTADQVTVARTRMLADLGVPAADWQPAIDKARAMWLAADLARRAAITEFVNLYRAQIFAERFLGADRPVRLDAVARATMPLEEFDGGRPPFPEPGRAGPLEADQDLTPNALHRIFPVVRRVTVDVDVPRASWPHRLVLADLPPLDPQLRTGRTEWLIETELAVAGAVIAIDGPQREVERVLAHYPKLVVLHAPDRRAEINDRGLAACAAVRRAGLERAYEEFRQAVRRVVAELDESPIAAPPPPPAAETRLRELLSRMGTELTAMADDVERGIAGPAAALDGGMTPQDAVRQWVSAQVHAWPQWPALLGALRHQVLTPSARHPEADLPKLPEIFEMRFRGLAAELPAACTRFAEAATGAWLRRWSVRLKPLKQEFLDVVHPYRERMPGAGGTVTLLRRGVQLGWLSDISPPAPGVLPRAAVRDAFPLDPERLLPWHDRADGQGPHGRHLMTIMRVRRELVIAAHRIADEQLAAVLAARAAELRLALRAQLHLQQRTDHHLRDLLGAPGPGPAESPQVLARRLERLLDAADSPEDSPEDPR